MKDLTPELISAFETSLQNLPPEESRRRKVKFIDDAVEAYGKSLKTSQKVLIALGVASVLFLPIFIISIPAFVHFLAISKLAKQQIRWTLEAWKNDLQEDYALLTDKLRSFWR